MKKGFTLLELIVVIIIIGILATLGFTQYTLVVERGRTAEARVILGQLRTAEIAYNQENGTYTGIGNIYVGAPQSCTSTHYFSYGASASWPAACGGAGWATIATRCTSGGKSPTYSTAYSLRLCIDSGAWNNDAPW